MNRTICILFVLLCAAAPVTAQITLPEPLAVEIPVDGQNTINAADPPLWDLLEAATSPQGAVTHDRVNFDFPLGPTLVRWSDGVGNVSAYVYVYPFGQTPVGSTDYERATSGNGGTNVVRDHLGRIHVAWLDSGRAVDQVLYRRGVQNPDTGAIAWEIEPLRISEGANDVYNSMVGVAVSDNYVHFVWYGGGNSSYYRRLRLSDDGLDPVRNTTAQGSLSNNGPDIAVGGDLEIHIVTPYAGSSGGQYALSLDGGVNWTVEEIPRPPVGVRMKATAVAVDSVGNAHIVFPWRIRASQFGSWSTSVPNRGHNELRYIRRAAAGGWEDAHYLLEQFPEWQDPLTDADPTNDDWDVISDWLEITVDQQDNIHVAWHGTINTHIFANDEAFYIRRPATGPGTWSANWDPFVSLWPVASGFSFAPSIAVDAQSRLAFPVAFYDTTGTEVFDSNVRLMRDGAWDGTPALSLTTMGADGYGLSTWFPCAAPTLYRHPNGRVWLDVIATDWPDEGSSDMIIVHQRREVTDLMPGSSTLLMGPGQLSWSVLNPATGYDVVRGDLQTLLSSGGDFTSATAECLVEDQAAASLAYATDPDPGDGYWFLVRGIDAGGAFTYDSLRPGQVGARDDEIDLAAGACF